MQDPCCGEDPSTTNTHFSTTKEKINRLESVSESNPDEVQSQFENKTILREKKKSAKKKEQKLNSRKQIDTDLEQKLIMKHVKDSKKESRNQTK